MTMLLDTVAFNFNLTRKQARVFKLVGRTQDGVQANFTPVTHSRILISHATSRDAASVVQTLVDVMTHNGGFLEWAITQAYIETLPLGTFPTEFLVSTDGVEFTVAAQGVINVLPNIDAA